MIIPLGITFDKAMKQYQEYEKIAVVALLANNIKRYEEYNKISNYYKEIAKKLRERDYNLKLKIH